MREKKRKNSYLSSVIKGESKNAVSVGAFTEQKKKKYNDAIQE